MKRIALGSLKYKRQNLIEMKDFEEYLDKMGYSWNDFDRNYEMANLIEQYADEKVKQALSIADRIYLKYSRCYDNVAHRKRS